MEDETPTPVEPPASAEEAADLGEATEEELDDLADELLDALDDLERLRAEHDALMEWVEAHGERHGEGEDEGHHGEPGAGDDERREPGPADAPEAGEGAAAEGPATFDRPPDAVHRYWRRRGS